MKKLLYIFFLLISFSCHSQFILIGKKICQLPQTSTISLYDWMVIEDSACGTTHKMQVVDFLTACGVNVDSTCVGSVFLKTDGSQTGALSSSQVFNLGVNTPIIKGNGTGVTVKDVSGAGIFINDSLGGDSISMAGGITNLTSQSTLVNKSPAILHLANYNSTLASTFRSLYNSAGTVGLTEWGDLSFRKNKTKVKLNDIDSSFLVHAHLKLDRLSIGSSSDSSLVISGGEVKKIAAIAGVWKDSSGTLLPSNYTDSVISFPAQQFTIIAAATHTGLGITTGIGFSAGLNNSGTELVAIGDGAAVNNTGNNVVGIGDDVLDNNTGNEVVGIGNHAGFNNTGDRVNFLGSAGQSNSGHDVNAFGVDAGYLNSGNYNNFLGETAGNTSTGSNVNAFGNNAYNHASGDNVNAFGDHAASVNSGDYVDAIGRSAAAGNSGNHVIGIGYHAGINNTLNNALFINLGTLDGDSVNSILYSDNSKVKVNGNLQATGNLIVAGTITNPTTPTISSGIIPPASTPSKVGDLYIDTVALKLYFSTGTSSSADWIIAN